MINIIQGFKVGSAESIDSRLLINEENIDGTGIDHNIMPDIYFAICKDTGMLYVYIKTARRFFPINDLVNDIEVIDKDGTSSIVSAGGAYNDLKKATINANDIVKKSGLNVSLIKTNETGKYVLRVELKDVNGQLISKSSDVEIPILNSVKEIKWNFSIAGNFIDVINNDNTVNKLNLNDMAVALNMATKTEVEQVNTALTEHVGNKNNPHNVTKAQIGLANVDNTSDVNKPISSAMQVALNLKADKTELSAKQDKINNLSTIIANAEAGAEAAASLPNYSTTVQMNTAIANHHDNTKVNVEEGMGLTSNDFTDELKYKLNNISVSSVNVEPGFITVDNNRKDIIGLLTGDIVVEEGIEVGAIRGPVTFSKGTKIEDILRAMFSTVKHLITIEHNEGGLTDKTSTEVLNHGSLTVTAIPNVGYIFSKWLLDNIEVSTNATYTISDVTAAHTLKALFVKTHTITVSANAGGVVDKLGDNQVVNGGTISITATPNSGFKIESWKLDGSIITVAGNTYTLENVTANHTIAVSFVELSPTEKIRLSCGYWIDGKSDVIEEVHDYNSVDEFEEAMATGVSYTEQTEDPEKDCGVIFNITNYSGLKRKVFIEQGGIEVTSTFNITDSGSSILCKGPAGSTVGITYKIKLSA